MRCTTLSDWLDYQQTLNPETIDLGLARVERVYKRLSVDSLATRVITVAGTNGKGSTVAAYEHWLFNQGFRVASYTSPHLLRYNERIRLGLAMVSDAALIQAFERVEQARGDDALTYFEFGTLAAFLLIADYQPDFAILEIGLGGRLDAVNIIDADLAHITMIGLDHQAWLGDSRDQIALEKAGILRAGKLAVCNDPDPPDALLERLASCGAKYRLVGRDYNFDLADDGVLQWRGCSRQLDIRMPLAQRFQGLNLAGVLAGLELLGCLQSVPSDVIAQGFTGIKMQGRFQTVESALAARLIVDVGHNIDAARVISVELERIRSSGRRIMLLGMLADKDADAFFSIVDPLVDEWWFMSLDCERGQSAQQLLQRVTRRPAEYRLFTGADEALAEAMSCLGNQDILVATGSFMTVEAVLKNIQIR